MARFQFAMGIANGRTAPSWGEATFVTAATLYTTGVHKEDLATLLWWWEGMLNKRGRREEAAKVRQYRVSFLGRRRAARSGGSTSPAAQRGKSAKPGAATVCGRRRRQG